MVTVAVPAFHPAGREAAGDPLDRLAPLLDDDVPVVGEWEDHDAQRFSDVIEVCLRVVR